MSFRTIALLSIALLAACGKNPTPPVSTEPLTIEVVWPQAPSVASSTQSVGVTAQSPSSTPAQVTLERGETSKVLQAPPGDVAITAKAFDQPGASGNVVAEAQLQKTVVRGQPNTVSLAVGGTTRVNVSLPVSSLEPNGSTQATAVAEDAEGRRVLTTFDWASTDPTIANVDATGKIQAQSREGSVEITATDKDSNVQGNAALNVTAPLPMSPVDEQFNDAKAPGSVIGGAVTGADAENRMSQRNSYLYMPVLGNPGWGKMSYSRGPFPRSNGLGAVVDISPADTQTRDTIREDLAVGFFNDPVTNNPATGSAVLLGESEEGEARASGVYKAAVSGGVRLESLTYRNTRRQVVTIVNDMGAFLYAVDMGGVPGGSSHPNMRFIGPSTIDPATLKPEVYFGLHSRGATITGKDSSTPSGGYVIPHLKIADTGLRNWWLTSAAAETGIGQQQLTDGKNSTGQAWLPLGVSAGELRRTAQGIKLVSGTEGRAYFSLGGKTPYLIGARIITGANPSTAEILFRVQDAANYYKAVFTKDNVQLVRRQANTDTVVDQTGAYRLQPNQTYDVVILLDGNLNRVWLNTTATVKGQQADGAAPENAPALEVGIQQTAGQGVGVGLKEIGDTVLTRLYVHEREVRIPQSLDIGTPDVARPTNPTWADEFDGTAGPLAGRSTTGKTWERAQGPSGIDFQIVGNGNARAGAALPAGSSCLLGVVPGASGGDLTFGSIIRQSATLETSFAGIVATAPAPGPDATGGYLAAMQFRDPSQGESSTEVELRYKGTRLSDNEFIWRRINMQRRFQSGNTNPISMRVVRDANGVGDWVAVWVGDEPIFYHPLSTDVSPLRFEKAGLYECQPSKGTSLFEHFRFY